MLCRNAYSSGLLSSVWALSPSGAEPPRGGGAGESEEALLLRGHWLGEGPGYSMTGIPPQSWNLLYSKLLRKTPLSRPGGSIECCRLGHILEVKTGFSADLSEPGFIQLASLAGLFTCGRGS